MEAYAIYLPSLLHDSDQLAVKPKLNSLGFSLGLVMRIRADFTEPEGLCTVAFQPWLGSQFDCLTFVPRNCLNATKRYVAKAGFAANRVNDLILAVIPGCFHSPKNHRESWIAPVTDVLCGG